MSAYSYQREVQKQNPPPLLYRLRVLVADDCRVIASGIAAILENIGVEIVGPVTSMTDAAAIVRATDFDVGIVSLYLEGQPTGALIRELHLRGVPAILLTSCDLNNAPQTMAAAVLQKPVRAESLLGELRSLHSAIRNERAASNSDAHDTNIDKQRRRPRVYAERCVPRHLPDAQFRTQLAGRDLLERWWARWISFSVWGGRTASIRRQIEGDEAALRDIAPIPSRIPIDRSTPDGPISRLGH